ncbi:MAG: hypothetical protein Q8O14_14715 [bacterium]|nr:hypothetical protein [bacterium]
MNSVQRLIEAAKHQTKCHDRFVLLDSNPDKESGEEWEDALNDRQEATTATEKACAALDEAGESPLALVRELLPEAIIDAPPEVLAELRGWLDEEENRRGIAKREGQPA